MDDRGATTTTGIQPHRLHRAKRKVSAAAKCVGGRSFARTGALSSLPCIRRIVVEPNSGLPTFQIVRCIELTQVELRIWWLARRSRPLNLIYIWGNERS